jgi:hypothetical protein
LAVKKCWCYGEWAMGEWAKYEQSASIYHFLPFTNQYVISNLAYTRIGLIKFVNALVYPGRFSCRPKYSFMKILHRGESLEISYYGIKPRTDILLYTSYTILLPGS